MSYASSALLLRCILIIQIYITPISNCHRRCNSGQLLSYSKFEMVCLTYL